MAGQLFQRRKRESHLRIRALRPAQILYVYQIVPENSHRLLIETVPLSILFAIHPNSIDEINLINISILVISHKKIPFGAIIFKKSYQEPNYHYCQVEYEFSVPPFCVNIAYKVTMTLYIFSRYSYLSNCIEKVACLYD